MFPIPIGALLLSATLSAALPVFSRDTVINQAATAQAQQRDNTATRAFTAVPIKVPYFPFYV